MVSDDEKPKQQNLDDSEKLEDKGSLETEINQSGQAGKDLVQVGRDYVKYLNYNIRSGSWIPIFFNLVVIGIFLYGIFIGMKSIVTQIANQVSKQRQNQIGSSKESSPAKKISPPENEAKPSKNPFETIQFPQDSCGDKVPTSECIPVL